MCVVHLIIKEPKCFFPSHEGSGTLIQIQQLDILTCHNQASTGVANSIISSTGVFILADQTSAEVEVGQRRRMKEDGKGCPPSQQN